MKRVLLGLAGMFACVAAGAALAAPPQDLIKSYYLGPSGQAAPLHVGRAYEASEFPISIRLVPPEPGWSGVQWKSGREYFRGGPPPNYGWVHLLRGDPTGIPQGLISIMTAYTKTPSVAAVANVLRTRGSGAAYDATSPATVAGFTGLQFDGRITGAKNYDHVGHYFIPFSPRSHAAKYYPDEYPVYGDVFRVIVLGVRGRTVVIYLENVGLAADQFPAFLDKATRILGSLHFSATKGG